MDLEENKKVLLVVGMEQELAEGDGKELLIFFQKSSSF